MSRKLAETIIDAWDSDKLKGKFWHDVVYQQCYPIMQSKDLTTENEELRAENEGLKAVSKFDRGMIEVHGFVMPSPREYALELYKRFKDRIEDLEIENEALKAKLDGGVRVTACPVTDNPIWGGWEAHTIYPMEQRNATLILDEGVEI